METGEQQALHIDSTVLVKQIVHLGESYFFYHVDGSLSKYDSNFNKVFVSDSRFLHSLIEKEKNEIDREKPLANNKCIYLDDLEKNNQIHVFSV